MSRIAIGFRMLFLNSPVTGRQAEGVSHGLEDRLQETESQLSVNIGENRMASRKA